MIKTILGLLFGHQRETHSDYLNRVTQEIEMRKTPEYQREYQRIKTEVASKR
jgi:hypothetical protein